MKSTLTSLTWVLATAALAGMSVPQKSKVQGMPVIYHHDKYGFTFALPETWRGYSVRLDQWTSNGDAPKEHGPILIFRHPAWTKKDPRHDIPILVLTRHQWDLDQGGGLALHAGGIETEVAHNDQYVFAIWTRFAFDDDVKGTAEAEQIVRANTAANEPHLPTP